METVLIFKSLTIVQSIAAYLGLIDSASADVKKLLHQSFLSAIRNLNYARNTTNPANLQDYIREAKNKFIESIAVEKDENLISSYIGLAMCQYALGDIQNAQSTLQEIGRVELSLSAKTRAAAFGGMIISPYNPVTAYYSWESRKECFEHYKRKAMQVSVL